MKKFILGNKNSIAGIAACLLLSGITMSFQDTPYVNQIIDNRTDPDTIPDKFSNSTMKMKELDGILKKLDKDMINVVDEMKDMELELIQQQAELALKEIDINQIMKNVEESLENIDVTELMADIKISLEDIDWKDKEGEIREAMQDAREEMEKVKIELKDIDKDEIRKDLQHARLEIEKSGMELKNLNMESIMNEAKKGMNAARSELQQLKAMFTEMEKDGLINQGKGFSIEYKDRELFINETKQSHQITDKYRKYFKQDHFKIKIEKE